MDEIQGFQDEREGGEEFEREYDWLDDPFDDRAPARAREQAINGKSGKGVIAIGCLAAFAVVLVLLILFVVNLVGFLG